MTRRGWVSENTSCHDSGGGLLVNLVEAISMSLAIRRCIIENSILRRYRLFDSGA